MEFRDVRLQQHRCSVDMQGVIVLASTSVPGAQTCPGQIPLGIYRIELLFSALCA